MSFKIKIKVELTLNHSALEEVLGEDYSFEEGKIYLDEGLKEVFKDDDDPNSVKVETLEITKVDDVTTTGALMRVGVK